ncbi:hypothetical protein J2Z48_000997 [Croceifilum oryzae]|uniref:Uncharacterized protein n=1 Tax=Croceifilum oryzae TaxID=1553429 RepID=A0AAJ1TDD1_9BACL|nr:hypothetical protein [Croceifilum oryzae]MDQ0416825.1 hypothetical protein [Croceifilum oryzae]
MAIHLSPEQNIYHLDHKKVCFIHVRTLSYWKDSLYKKLERLCLSGLYQKLDAIFINFVVDDIHDIQYIKENIIDPLSHYDDTIRYRILPEEYQYERATLHWIHQYSSASINNVEVLYLHSKGVRRGEVYYKACIEDWVNLMETVLVDYHEVSFAYLKKVDSCGINFFLHHPYPPHYSGNVWWANSHYIKQLTGTVPPDGLAPEMWILSHHTVTFAEIFNSGYPLATHYTHPFPKENIPTHFQPIVYHIDGNGLRVCPEITG